MSWLTFAKDRDPGICKRNVAERLEPSNLTHLKLTETVSNLAGSFITRAQARRCSKRLGKKERVKDFHSQFGKLP